MGRGSVRWSADSCSGSTTAGGAEVAGSGGGERWRVRNGAEGVAYHTEDGCGMDETHGISQATSRGALN